MLARMHQRVDDSRIGMSRLLSVRSVTLSFHGGDATSIYFYLARNEHAFRLLWCSMPISIGKLRNYRSIMIFVFFSTDCLFPKKYIFICTSIMLSFHHVTLNFRDVSRLVSIMSRSISWCVTLSFHELCWGMPRWWITVMRQTRWNRQRQLKLWPDRNYPDK